MFVFMCAGCLRHAFSQAEDSDVSNPDEAALQAEGFLIQTLLNELRYKPTELYDLVRDTHTHIHTLHTHTHTHTRTGGLYIMVRRADTHTWMQACIQQCVDVREGS